MYAICLVHYNDDLRVKRMATARISHVLNDTRHSFLTANNRALTFEN